MLPPGYVRRELVAVLTPVAADVALEGVSVVVAAHVNGVHDVVQEEYAARLAAVRSHLLAVRRHHLEAVGGHLPDGVVPLLLLLDQRQHAVPHAHVVGQVDEAGGCARPVFVVALGVGGVLAAVAGRAVLVAGRRLG